MRIKSVVFFCLYYSGLEWVLARLIRADAVAVLMYHGVCDGAQLPAAINFHVTRRVFERQMRVLKRRYRVVPLADVIAALARGERLQKAVVLTFDDGYKNNAQYAAPVLSRLNLPATIFVATAYVETQRWLPLNQLYHRWSSGQLSTAALNDLRALVRQRPWAEAREAVEAVLREGPGTAATAANESFAMLSWDEMRPMANGGIAFGSHTHSHCNMAVESPAQQRAELLVSRELLEARLQRPARLFAYPYGRAEHMSETARRNVIEAGYECAVSGEYGIVTSRSDPFRLPRLGSDRRLWMFTGDILYHMVVQALRDVRSKFARGATPARTIGYHKT